MFISDFLITINDKYSFLQKFRPGRIIDLLYSKSLWIFTVDISVGLWIYSNCGFYCAFRHRRSYKLLWKSSVN